MRYLCQKYEAMTIRRNVEFILRTKAMNKVELAEKCGTSTPNLTHYLDSNNIGLKALQKIAKALEVTPADLIAVPHLSSRNMYHEDPLMPLVHKPSKATFTCPSCGHKLVATIEEIGAEEIDENQ